MLLQNAADNDSDFGSCGFADGPVDRGTLTDTGDEFVVAHCLDGALVHGQGVVEADFVFVQAEVFAALGGGLHLFGQLDQFVDHLLSGDGSVVVGGQGLLQHLAEDSRLDDVSLAALLDLVLEQLGKQFDAGDPRIRPAGEPRLVGHHRVEQPAIEPRIPCRVIHGLKELNLADAGLNDASLKKLPNLSTRNRLVLDGNDIRGQGQSRLSGLAQLESLELRRTKVTATSIAEPKATLRNCLITWDDTEK